MKQMGSRIKELFYLAQFGTLLIWRMNGLLVQLLLYYGVISAAGLLDCKVN